MGTLCHMIIAVLWVKTAKHCVGGWAPKVVHHNARSSWRTERTWIQVCRGWTHAQWAILGILGWTFESGFRPQPSASASAQAGLQPPTSRWVPCLSDPDSLPLPFLWPLPSLSCQRGRQRQIKSQGASVERRQALPCARQHYTCTMRGTVGRRLKKVFLMVACQCLSLCRLNVDCKGAQGICKGATKGRLSQGTPVGGSYKLFPVGGSYKLVSRSEMGILVHC